MGRPLLLALIELGLLLRGEERTNLTILLLPERLQLRRIGESLATCLLILQDLLDLALLGISERERLLKSLQPMGGRILGRSFFFGLDPPRDADDRAAPHNDA